MECAFGILKSRWRILRTQIGSNVALVSDIVIACAVLHNFCISVGDEWEIEDYGNDADDGSDNDNVLRDGETLRDLLKDYTSNL